MHYEALAAGNMAEAIALWDRFAPYGFRHIVCHRADRQHDFHLPSIFSSFMPKSGGTFTHNRMVQSLGYSEFYWAIPHPMNAQDIYVSRAASRIYTLGGFTAHCHMLPVPAVTHALADIRDTPFWVHIRNPVDCVVASFHHYLGQAQGEGELGASRRTYNAAEAQRLSLNLSDINAFASAQLPFFVGWLRTWTDYATLNPQDVVFSFFDELDNPQGMFDRILHHYGAACPKVTDLRRRQASDRLRHPGDERHELIPVVRARLLDMAASELKGFRHRDRILA
jgi:hypothetical protein